MKAGRELDALVAEKVMGAVWMNMTPKGRKKVLTFPKSRPMVLDEGGKMTYYGYGDGDLPKYSTDIAAARQVVQKMSPSWFYTISNAHKPEHVSVSFWMPGESSFRVDADAKTEAEAICLAALKALGVEVDREPA